MAPILYTTNTGSPPARAVENIAKIAGIELELRNLNLLQKENLESWFIKLNPTHQVPVLNDDGFVVSDSHAIIDYLMNVYAPKDFVEKYYPSDPKKRAIIHSMMHFENGTLFARLKLILLPMLLKGEKDTPLEKIELLAEALYFLEKILENKEWLAGDRLTVADISTIATIDLAEILLPLSHYKNISQWVERVRKNCPYYEEFGGIRVARTRDVINMFSSTDAAGRWKKFQEATRK